MPEGLIEQIQAVAALMFRYYQVSIPKANQGK